MTLSSLFEPEDPVPVPPIPTTMKVLILISCTVVTAAVLLVEVYGRPKASRPSGQVAKLGALIPGASPPPDDCTAARRCYSGGSPCRN